MKLARNPKMLIKRYDNMMARSPADVKGSFPLTPAESIEISQNLGDITLNPESKSILIQKTFLVEFEMTCFKYIAPTLYIYWGGIFELRYSCPTFSTKSEVSS